MTAPHADQLIDGYLARLRVAATDLPSSVREELIEDMRAHIAEARAREPEETDATILNILDRLGDPEVLVAEARQRPSAAPSTGASIAPWLYRSGIIEIAAIVLLPFIWLIGVILLWVSPAWNTRDKIIGTVLSLGGYPAIYFFGAAVAISSHPIAVSSCSATTDSSGNTVGACTGPSWISVLLAIIAVLATVVVFLLPILTSIYLALRLRRGRRPQAIATA